MSLESSGGMSPADLAVVTGNGGGFGRMFCGDGAWFLIILFLFAFMGWGNGGWGGNGAGAGAQENYVLVSDFAQVERKLDTVNAGLCDGFYSQAQLTNGVQMALANGFANAELARANSQSALTNQLFGIQSSLQQCCCDNKQAIAGVNYNSAMQTNQIQHSIDSGFCSSNYAQAQNTRDVIDNQNANSRAILDAIRGISDSQKDARIAEQAQRINSLELAASQAAQNNYLVNQLRPSPVPAFSVPNPYSYSGCNCNSGCGC